MGIERIDGRRVDPHQDLVVFLFGLFDLLEPQDVVRLSVFAIDHRFHTKCSHLSLVQRIHLLYAKTRRRVPPKKR